MNAVTVIDISAGVIAKGQRAWTKIKATAEEQRVLWLEVGTALMAGKIKENRAKGQLFSEWVQERFPGLHMAHAADVLWFAENSNSVLEIPEHLSHPQIIRQWSREQQVTAGLPSDAPEVTIVSTPKFATHRDAVKFIKVDQRAESGGEGADTAKRHRKLMAMAKDTTVEALRKEASATAPYEAYRFNPTAQKAIDSMRSNLRGSAAAMERDGLTKDQIKDIFLQFANSL
jgi:hypothetical protein